ncbi:LamG domain-containing protein [Mucilaginibacter sp.]|uniref:LamG domain-containing protein n=1 Tax=Mucilaginibacter sp. TaxID=1882438 RepID=UPI002849DB20|nr:LamG domain-containing protein [Mucilaginibacter sp.]MDR3694282.1 LamG domain-containing protein [Mucilaginibacter sp.]
MMKSIKKTLMAGLAGSAIILSISACQKSFDPKTYAPTKPLPTFGGYSSSKDIEPGNLVAYWPFNGSLADSLSATTGVATGTSFGTGVIGKGLQGADNGYVVSNTPAAVKALHSFTISLWVKMPQNTSALGLISIAHSQNFWGNLDIFFDNGGTATTGVLKVHAFNNSTSTSGSDAWEGGYTVANPWNAWVNIEVTYDDSSSTVIVYYNGAQAGTNTAAGFAPLNWSAADKIAFGTLQFQTTPSLTSATGAQGWAGYLTGVLDQVRIYNKVLSSSEASALYNLEKLGR